MSSVYFDPAVGGDGSTVTDDLNASTGLANGGHRTRFVPAMGQVVAVADFVVTTAGDVSVDATAAAASASAAAVSQTAAAVSQTAAATSASNASSSATAAATSASNASSSATAAATSASSALNAPGTSATSTTSLTISPGTKTLTIQTGKAIVVGMSVVIAYTTTPTNRMSGVVTAYDDSTGALEVTVGVINGAGMYTAWTVSIGNAVPDAATQAEMEAGTEASLRSVSPLRIKQAITATASLLGHTHTGTYEPVQTAATQAEMVSGTVSDVRSMSPLRVKQAMVVGYVARTANAMLAVGDFGKFIDITSGTFTQTFAAAATLGEGWWCYLRNAGTGDITLDPNASETIDGVTSGVIVAGDTYIILCTGTSFITERRQNGPMRIELKTSSGSWTAPLGVRNARVTVVGGGAGAGASGVGSGGGTAIKTFNVQPGTSYSYVVGAAGTSSGTNGGSSTFEGSVTITGSGGTSASSANSVVGGGASNGDINIAGGSAVSLRPYDTSDPDRYCTGGGSMYGFGATCDSFYTLGGPRPASGYGGGGADDQAGTQGCVIIEY